LLLALTALASAASAEAPARYIDYLHVEANEGGSSGGHVAVRFGVDVFHFQQHDGGFIRMVRDDAEIFHFRYAMLGNRPIHETRIAVSDDTFTLLRATFSERLLIQQAQYERLAVLQDDVALLDLWLRRTQSAGAGGVPVRAAGYFLPDGAPSSAVPAARSSALLALQARIAAAHGAGFIARRAAAMRAELSTWQPRAQRDRPPALAADAYPGFAPLAAMQYRDQLEGLTGLEVLAAAPALRPDAYRIDTAGAPLDARERRRLLRFAEQLSIDLTALAASARADFGYPLLVGMARLAAIEESLAHGQLVVLDAFAPDAPAAALPEGAQRDAYLRAIATRLRPAAARARGELFAQSLFREGDYTHLETALNRLLEVDGARRLGTPLRTQSGLLLPGRPARRDELIAPILPPAAVAAERRIAMAAVQAYRDRLLALYGYNLVSRNCVSEIFAVIDAGLSRQGGGGADESRRRLGGVVQTGASLNFIPAMSAAAVARNYATVATRSHRSYRQLRLEALAAGEPAWRVYVRESNTLTSTVYHPADEDSAFLFFTDESPALRPLLGTVNLLTAIAGSVVGLATWPVDSGARLGAGLRGALFSLPELAFVSIRKGSMAWVEPETVAGD
jgi:hypothetical protein